MERYDIDEYAVRAVAALDKLRAEHEPDAKDGRGGKAAVLRAVREQIREALRAGYTIPQLIDALRGVFGGELSAKTVRAALRDDAVPSRGAAKTTKRRHRRKAAGIAVPPAASSALPTASPPADKVTHPVQPPSERPWHRRSELYARETEIRTLVAEGYSLQQIVNRLGLAVHRSTLHRWLRRAEAARA